MCNIFLYVESFVGSGPIQIKLEIFNVSYCRSESDT